MFHFLHNKKRKRAKSDKRAQKITQQLSAKLKGKDLQYTLTQSPNARTVRLKINMNNGLEIVVPRNFSINHAPHIVAEHERWILKQLDKMEKRKQRSEQHQLHDGVTITVLDQHHTVKIIPQMKGKKPYVKRVQKLEFADETATEQANAERHAVTLWASWIRRGHYLERGWSSNPDRQTRRSS